MRQYIRQLRFTADQYLEKYISGGHPRHIRYAVGFFLVVFFTATIGFHFFFAAPDTFPVGSLVEIERGMSIEEAGRSLEENHVVQSRFAFMAFVKIFGNYRGVIAGSYYFDVPETVLGIALRMTQGDYNLKLVRVTIPEGVHIRDIADILETRVPSFKRNEFLAAAEDKEGYLFPDTYFFLPNVSNEEIIRVMTDNFAKKTAPLAAAIAESGHTLEEIIIMASIVEKETIELRDKPVVAGILWKRIDIGMRLQVDAPFLYAIGKNTFDLSLKDLRSDFPYNTYTREGLPPTPIANPGLDSIIAAIQSKETPYLFYLSDRLSNMHYSRTFDEHKANKRRYLY